MTEYVDDRECPAGLLADAAAVIEEDDDRGLAEVDRLLREYPLDPRLHFLRGSLLAAMQLYEEGHAAMLKSVEIAPHFAIARFQLGFLELTSGDGAAAEATWQPLDELAPEDPLRLFSVGLRHLIRDEFGKAIDFLREGMAHNRDNPALNNDMRMIIDEARTKIDTSGAEAEPMSLTQLALKQSAAKSTKH